MQVKFLEALDLMVAQLLSKLWQAEQAPASETEQDSNEGLRHRTSSASTTNAAISPAHPSETAAPSGTSQSSRHCQDGGSSGSSAAAPSEALPDGCLGITGSAQSNHAEGPRASTPCRAIPPISTMPLHSQQDGNAADMLVHSRPPAAASAAAASRTSAGLQPHHRSGQAAAALLRPDAASPQQSSAALAATPATDGEYELVTSAASSATWLLRQAASATSAAPSAATSATELKNQPASATSAATSGSISTTDVDYNTAAATDHLNPPSASGSPSPTPTPDADTYSSSPSSRRAVQTPNVQRLPAPPALTTPAAPEGQRRLPQAASDTFGSKGGSQPDGESQPHFAICITGDHSTPVAYGDHSHDPVPFAIAHVVDAVESLGGASWASSVPMQPIPPPQVAAGETSAPLQLREVIPPHQQHAPSNGMLPL